MPRRPQGKTPTGLGKALVNANHRPRNQLRADRASLHYADLTTLPSSSAEPSALSSVTERNELDEFLHTAMQKEEAFEAEKQQLVVLEQSGFEARAKKREYTAHPLSSPSSLPSAPLPSIPIPRRPQWTTSMSAEELAHLERDAFLAWRRSLAELEEAGEVAMTPFEKNAEVWKQLWRVIERCAVVATIVDARNPLLYRSPDLEAYVREVGGDGGKVNVLVVNKADYLGVEQRAAWVRWFDREGVHVVFFSAVRAIKAEEERERKERERERRKMDREARRERGLIVGLRRADLEEIKEAEVVDDEKEDGQTANPLVANDAVPPHAAGDDVAIDEEEEEEADVDSADEDGTAEEKSAVEDQGSGTPSVAPSFSQGNSTDILTRDQLLDYFRQAHFSIHPPSSSTPAPSPTSRIQVGFVGFPNVGKSSTINALMLEKRVTVGATPGKTKHFQTLNVGDDLTLCDCPGLVMPTFLASRAELVCNGVMPIDQMREYANYTAPIALMVRRVGLEQLREQYSLAFPNWRPLDDDADGDDEEYRRRAEELLNTHARMRGWMKDHGRPDESRSARVLLKDLFTGKLLYCYQPPGMSEEEKAEWRRSAESSRRGERIVGQWKGDEEDEAGDRKERGARGDGGSGKVNVHVMEQMLRDDYDEDLPLTAAQAALRPPLSKKALLRERQREKRRTGKSWKLKKTLVAQDDVQMRMGGLSAVPAARMGVVQSSTNASSHRGS